MTTEEIGIPMWRAMSEMARAVHKMSVNDDRAAIAFVRESANLLMDGMNEALAPPVDRESADTRSSLSAYVICNESRFHLERIKERCRMADAIHFGKESE